MYQCLCEFSGQISPGADVSGWISSRRWAEWERQFPSTVLNQTSSTLESVDAAEFDLAVRDNDFESPEQGCRFDPATRWQTAFLLHRSMHLNQSR